MSKPLKKISPLSLEKRKLLGLLLREEEVEVKPQNAIPRRDITGPLPLSFAQERLWFLDQLAPGSVFYNVPLGVHIRGQLRTAPLENCLNVLVQRHETLRTTIKVLQGNPAQVIAPVQSDAEKKILPLPLHDLEPIPEAGARTQALQRLLTEEAQRPFDLERGPLVRAILFRLANDEHYLLLTMHHCIADGWSIGVLVRELSALYTASLQGQPSPLPDLPIQYADFALWQRRQMGGEALARQLTYWRQQLADSPTLLELPTDHPRPAVQTFRGARHLFLLSPLLTAQLQAVSQREGTTLFMSLLTVFLVLLYRYTSQDDLVVGTPIANRPRSELEGLIGLFANTLALRVNLAGRPGFRQALRRVREVALQAYAHQDLPFEQVVEALRPERNLSYNPLVQVMFALQNAPLELVEPPGTHLQLLSVETGTVKCDLTLSLMEVEGGLRGAFEYNTALFDAARIERMERHFHNLLVSLLADLDRPISELSMLTDEEQRQVLLYGNATHASVLPARFVRQLVEEQAQLAPMAPAVIEKQRRITYHELNEQANLLAGYLRTCGVGPEVPVGVCMRRCVEMVVALLAVLKAGGAYVPLDPSYPRERIAFMLQDAGASLILTDQLRLLADPGRTEICLDDHWQARLAQHLRGPQPASDILPDQPAYVIYTSGSSGRPKGVVVSQSNLAHLVAWHQQAFHLTPADRVSQVASLSFDAAGWELWPALCNGSCVVLADEETRLSAPLLRDWLGCEGITISFVPTPLAEELLTLDWPEQSSLRVVLTGGDTLHRGVRARLPFQVVNNYGPTEATVLCTSGTVELEEELGAGAKPSIGRPILGASCYVMDRWGQLVPPGQIGELYIGGTGVARGYRGKSALTAERFVPDPFSGQRGGRLYRTGDLVRWLADGRLEFVGRRDKQVKVRGYRIEPGEIEVVLKEHAAVRGAVVLARATPSLHGSQEQSLLAFIVPAAKQIAARELRDFLQSRLPSYMVPGSFVFLSEMPLTPNGKLDRRALLTMGREGPAQEELDSAPRNQIEELLMGIWRVLLPAGRIGVQENFFELGGHSLLATRLVTRIRDVFRIDLPLRTVFEAPTIAELAVRLTGMRRGEGEAALPPLLPRTQQGMVVPLSFAQQRLWFLDQLTPGSTDYSISTVFRLQGQLSREALQAACNEMIRRHEPLRTTFASTPEGPVQVIALYQERALPFVDLCTLSPRDRAREAQRLALEEASQPFDLLHGPLFRIRVLRVEEREHLLLLTLHHSIADGWSIAILLRELSALYRASQAGQPATLPPLPIRYADFVLWERQWLQSEALERQLAYWTDQLRGAPAALELPTDHPRPTAQPCRAGRCTQRLAPTLVTALKTLSLREHATLFMILLAAFKVLLTRYSWQEDIVVGVPVANRAQVETEELIGFFVNTLAIRTVIADNPPFLILLRRLREQLLEAYRRQDAPFDLVVQAVQPERTPGRYPLFQVMFSYDETSMLTFELPDLTIQRERPPYQGMTRFDLDVTVAHEVRDDGEELQLHWGYNADLFDEATILRMLGHYTTLLEHMLAEPERPVLNIPLLTAAEYAQIVVAWNATEVPYPAHLCLHQLFEVQAASTPEAVALAFEDQALTYRELDQQATRLANYLLAQGVEPEMPVGLAFSRSLPQFIALLAVLKAGGAYVPLDPTYPPQRLAFMLEETQISLLLTQHHLLKQLPPHHARVICVENDWSPPPEDALAPSTRPVVLPEHLAYILYTSGSTGKPKGAMISHRSLVSYALDAARRFRLGPGDRVLQFASMSFDVMGEEIFPAWLAGATVVLRRDDMSLVCADFLRALARLAISAIELPPAYWHELVYEMAQHGEAGVGWPASLRTVILGGEQPGSEHLAQWQAQVGSRIALLNTYGLTETTITSIFYDVPDAQPCLNKRIPIGRPGANTQVYVLDKRLAPVPVGVPGELYIGGVPVGRGYFRRPALTALSFVPDPFGSGGLLYRTGDSARYLPDGNLEFLGRVDQQVKLRGFRIEPGEIEAVLKLHPGIREALVVMREDAPGAQHLIAYYQPVQEVVAATELRQLAQQHVPAYMIPEAFVPLEAFPLSPTGKIDRARLPAPTEDVASAQGEVAARTPIEGMLVKLWQDLLHKAHVGIHENFFWLGGHSLLAVQMIARVRSLFHVELPLTLLFEQPTIAEMARHIERAMREEEALEELPLLPREQATERPLSFAQQRLWFLDQLAPGQPTYHLPLVLRLTGRLDNAALERAVNALIARHESLRTVFQEQEGQPSQIVLPALALTLGVDHLEQLAEDERAQAMHRRIVEEIRRPFDLEHGPLARALVLRLSEDEHVFLLTMHHIISDGWSMEICLRELALLYEACAQGKPSPLPPLALQYTDFAAWQRAWFQGEVLRRQLAYWQATLSNLPAALNLPTDYPRPAVQSYHGGWQAFAWPEALAQALQSLSRQHGVTLYMTLLAAFQVLLARYSGQDDIVVGAPVANRTRAEIEGLIGFFVNTLVLRTNLSGNPDFRTLLGRVRETTLGAYMHQDLPFEYLVEILQPERNLSHTPLFQVAFVLQDGPPLPRRFADLEMHPMNAETQVAKFDLTLAIMRDEHGLHGGLEYRSDLFTEATIAHMLEHLRIVLEHIVAHPDWPLARLPLLSEAEQHRLLIDWNSTYRPYHDEKCLHQLFEAQVERTPAALAVRYAGRSLTYREVNEQANQLAHYLRKRNVGPEVLVGVFLERSPILLIALLGILKAGGAYMPLDPDYPHERLAFLLADSASPIVLTTHALAERLPTLEGETQCVVYLDEEWERIASEERANPFVPLRGDNAIYMLYTSGSTGRPKGVINTHRGLCNRLRWMQETYQLDASDRVLQKTPCSFDVSAWEFFWPLIAGATLVLARPAGERDPAYLRALIREEQLTTLHFVPSLLNVFLEEEDLEADCRSLRRVICSGEALSLTLQRRFFARCSAELHNLYGPTEAAIDVTSWPCEPAGTRTCVPIGRPIANTRIYLLDAHLQPVPIGVPGELYIGGFGLARGYHRRSALTAERFLPDPFSSEPGARLYRTGDLARYGAEGTLEYLGRLDQQVKLRGLRIELGEIEAALREHGGVQEAAVLLRQRETEGEEDRQLVAYLVPDDRQAAPVRRLLHLDQQSPPLPRCELPNGMLIFGKNRSEIDFLYQEIFEARTYLKHGISLSEGDCLFDVGANIGLFSLFAARLYPSVRIYAFEPIPAISDLLRANVQLYDLPAHVFSCGLSNENTTAAFTYYPHVSILSGRYADAARERAVVGAFLRQQDAFAPGETEESGIAELLQERLNSEQVHSQVKTLSTVLRECQVERIDLLKVDAEGSELDVLTGIEEPDWKKIKQIVLEVSGVEDRLKQVVEILRRRGYLVAVEQDNMLAGAHLYTVYARREREARRCPEIAEGAAPTSARWCSPQRLIADVRAGLSARLPDYMVPSAFVLLERLPVTANGKLDRQALPAPEARSSRAAAPFAAPQNELERAVAAIWKDVLGVATVGRDENFFDLGGHSLLLMKVQHRLRIRLGREIAVVDLFRYPTIKALAQFLAGGRAEPAGAPVVFRRAEMRRETLRRQRDLRQARHREQKGS